MSFKIRRQLYESLPSCLQRTVCLLPFSLIAGRAYRAALHRGHWMDAATPCELKRYQQDRLETILKFVVSQVPAYSHLKSVVEHERPLDALKSFPVIDKDAIQKDPSRYLPRDFLRLPHYEVTTGGTSGNQLKLFLDNDSQSTEMGFVHRFWGRMGYTPRHRKATFRGVKFENLRKEVFWKANPIYQELQFSPFHMSESNLAAYLEAFIRYGPRYIHGYPSAVDTLAEYVIRIGASSRIPAIKAAFLASESCTPMQRERIEKAFHTRVFSWYGHTERLIFGGECEKNSTYHHFPDYGILEIIGDDGNLCEKEGERGELVGTGLNNFCMPLVRYRTGDYATRLNCNCECGRQWDRFSDVDGRWKQDMIIGRQGSRISVAALNMHGPFFDNVVRYQYHQTTPGVCSIKVVVNPAFSERDLSAIESAYQKKVGDEVKFHVQVVSEIPLTARGKVKLLDSQCT